MYLLFKSVDSTKRGIIQIVGSWMEYSIGYLPDTHVNIVDYRHLNPKILDEDVALSWMFFGAHRPYISVRTNTTQNERLQVIRSEEPEGTKSKYFLTEQDINNTVILMQECMRLILDEYYDKQLIQLNATVSDLEFNTWETQKKEAELFAQGETNLPLLNSLAQSRNISISEMVEKVNQAITSYNNMLFDLFSSKQKIEKEIKDCVSILECNKLLHLRFGVEMPMAQRTDDNIDHSAIFNLT